MKIRMLFLFFFLLIPLSSAFAGEGVLKIYIKNSTTGLVKVWVDPHRIVTRCDNFPYSHIWIACLADPVRWSNRKWREGGLDQGPPHQVSTALPDRIPMAQAEIDPGESTPIFFKKGQHLFFCFNVRFTGFYTVASLPRFECMMAAFRMVDIPPRGHLMFTVAGPIINTMSAVPFSKSHFSIIDAGKK